GVSGGEVSEQFGFRLTLPPLAVHDVLERGMAGHGLLLDRPRPRKTKSAIGEVMEKWIDVRRVIDRGGAEIQNRLLGRAAARLSYAISERRRYCGSGRSRPRTCCADRRASVRS